MNIVYYIYGVKIKHPKGISAESMALYDEVGPKFGLTIIFSNDNKIAIIGRLLLQVTSDEAKYNDVAEVERLSKEMEKATQKIIQASGIDRYDELGYWLTIEDQDGEET